MKDYAFRVRREATYVEVVETIIRARSSADAERIAAGIGDGAEPNWPVIVRYNTSEIDPARYELIETELVRVDEINAKPPPQTA